MTSSFSYAALPPDSIRLLHVAPPTPSDSQLVCRIEEVQLDSPPRFYALSYTWGTPGATSTMLCNGHAMEIAANLHEAICTLFTGPDRVDLPIWIDAVCINQKDEDEKAIQVAMMGDVYRRATKVVVWLGPGTVQSDLAMDSLEWLGRALETIPHLVHGQELQISGLPDEHNEIWPALGHLYRRKWFGRLWTFQEAVLAADIKVFCGLKSATWTVLATVAGELYRLNLLHGLSYGFEDVEKQENGVLAVANINLAKQAMAEDGELEATYTIMISDQKLCFDPRDRVYAVLGLVGSSFRNRIHISYANTSNEGFLKTFIECSKACIEEKLPIILETVVGRTRTASLPSWCPNLQSSQGAMELFGDHVRAGISGDSLSFETFQGKTCPGSNKLTITGFRVDIVSNVVEETFSWPTVQPGEQQYKRAQGFLDWEGRCLSLAQRAMSDPLETVSLHHVLTLSSHTRHRLPEVADTDLYQSYIDILHSLRVGLPGLQHEDKFPIPTERRARYDKTWREIAQSCSGRLYFSTEGGRLGLGPSEIKKGDTICVFYGARTVFILRPAERNPEEWFFVGDAFVHGLMELDETPESARGSDEDFVIV